MARRIEIVPYDPAWTAAYQAEAARLGEVLGPDLGNIHHIGSTAVAGLAAKPIIDILAEVRDVARIPMFDAGMASLGYRSRGECLDAFGTPGRFYYSKDADGLRTHQVHVMQAGHFDIRRKLVLRDYLRAHPQEAQAYGHLKRQLAEENTQGIAEYIRGKDAFVRTLIRRALVWSGLPAERVAINDMTFLVSLLEDLGRCAVAAWIFGGWAEELLGLRNAGPHGDVDLLYPASDFTRIDALLQSHPDMIEIPQKRFSHKRAAEYRGIRVEFFLVQQDGGESVTRFFDGRFIHRWPADTFLCEVGSAGRRLPVASAGAVQGYRQVHAQAVEASRKK